MRRIRPALVSLTILTISFLGLQACGSDSGGGTDPVTVASVAVTAASASIEIGESTQFSATVTGSNGSTLAGRTVTWGSSDSGVASVNSSGLVTGVAEGTGSITATVEGVVGGAPIAVTTAVVDAVNITPASPSVEVGQTAQLTATPVDARGDPLTDRDVTWASDDESVATVSAAGLLTGVAAGDVLIRATSEGVVASVTASVVPRSVATVEVDPSTAEVDVGGTAQLAAVTKDSDGNVLTGRTVGWASSDVAVATVDDAGLVSGVAVGTATITATSEGQVGGSAVTVSLVSVGSVELSTAGDAIALEEGGTLQATAVVKDTEGNVLEGRTVNWSTSNASVATVGSDGLITGAAVGDVTITAESGGESATVDLTVEAPSFEPDGDTSTGGEVDVNDFTVPDGVTVTVTEDLVINATGDFTIAGSLEGDCVAITVNGEGDINITGDIDNSCADPTASEDITIVGNGAMDLTNMVMASSGNVVMKNDPTLTEEEFADLETDALMAGPRRSLIMPADGGFTCGSDGARFAPSGPAANGGNAASGDAEDGESARTWTMYCSGDFSTDGGTDIEAEDGGNGGNFDNSDEPEDGEDANSGDAGRGGNGGNLRMRSRGTINFNGARGGTTLHLGDGGTGGKDTKIGGGPGASATAVGGDGGDSGSFSILARGGINIAAGGLEIRLGTPGEGGAADATGIDGRDAGAEAAQDGGSGTATGGKGGSHPNGRLRASGSVTGAGNVIITGPDAGAGGDATAEGGTGGEGNKEFPDGANGGAMSATAGAGGEANTRDLSNVHIADGGMGGSIDLFRGHGGFGYSDCVVGEVQRGGNGGDGGDAFGAVGIGGTGFSDGDNGSVFYGPISIGGDGGYGDGPGTGGQPGANNIDSSGDAESTTVDNPVFEPGQDGGPCLWTMDVNISVVNDPEGHEPFIGLTDTDMLEVELTADGKIHITGNGVIPDLEGDIAADGSFVATGTGTLAGFAGSTVTLTGTMNGETGITGELTAFNSSFPGSGDTVTYSVTTTAVTGSPGG